jgi:L-lactate dehydrogenase complex protein LldG
MADQQTFIDRVRRALKRDGSAPPAPPEIDEPMVRLVHSEIGLPELFTRMANAAMIGATLLRVEDLSEQLIAALRQRRVRTIGVSRGGLVDKLSLPATLREAGFDVRSWSELSREQLYSLDCGLTDAWAAIAETGSIVIRSSPHHGRSLSLVPPLHVAVIEPKNIVPDLVDLMPRITAAGDNPGTVLITGPSKTADIEMNLVTGVHGPGEVLAFVLN